MTQRVLITGASNPAAMAFLRACDGGGPQTLFMGDADPESLGLQLVPRERRLRLRRVDARDYAPRLLELCLAMNIDAIVPTSEEELWTLASWRRRFEQRGILLMMPPADVLCRCADLWSLWLSCQGAVHQPRTALVDAGFDPSTWRGPALLRPRRSGRDAYARRIESAAELRDLRRDGAWLIQQPLPGPEYTVLICTDRYASLRAAVPIVRVREGVGRCLKDAELIRLAALTADRLGLRYISGVRFRSDAAGRPALISVLPRVTYQLQLAVLGGANMPRVALDDLLSSAPAQAPKAVAPSVPAVEHASFPRMYAPSP